MKFDMPTCVSILSDDKLERLETIIRKKYKKFIGFYRMIENQMDMIQELEYEDDSDDSELIVLITFDNDINTEDKAKEIHEYFDTRKQFKDSWCKASDCQVTVGLSLYES